MRQDIQSLRGLAIIFVFLYHLYPSVFVNGFLGVDIFFVISGYLMAKNLTKFKLKKLSDFSGFYYRRFKRILPLYFLVVFISVVLVHLFLGDFWWRINWRYSIASLFLVTNQVLIHDSADYFKHFYESVDPRCFECPTGSLCAATANDTEIFCIVRYKLNEIPIGNSCTLPLIVISMIVGFLLLMNILSVFLLIRRRRIQVYDLPTTMDERSAVYRAEADLIRKIGQWKASQDESLIDETSGADATEKPGKPNEDLMNSDDTTCEEINGVQVEDCAADGKSEENWAKKVVENREIEE